MAELSLDEVVGVLGRLSDVIIAEIIATGITRDELAAARSEWSDRNPQTRTRLEADFAQVVEIGHPQVLQGLSRGIDKQQPNPAAVRVMQMADPKGWLTLSPTVVLRTSTSHHFAATRSFCPFRIADSGADRPGDLWVT
jgi:hypothetical protein